MKTELKLKYLKTIQESYKKGLITKRDWKRERISIRENKNKKYHEERIHN